MDCGFVFIFCQVLKYIIDDQILSMSTYLTLFDTLM